MNIQHYQKKVRKYNTYNILQKLNVIVQYISVYCVSQNKVYVQNKICMTIIVLKDVICFNKLHKFMYYNKLVKLGFVIILRYSFYDKSLFMYLFAIIHERCSRKNTRSVLLHRTKYFRCRNIFVILLTTKHIDLSINGIRYSVSRGIISHRKANIFP